MPLPPGETGHGSATEPRAGKIYAKDWLPMTLIATMFDRNGVVLATDSNLTSSNRVTREAQETSSSPTYEAG